MIKVDHIYKKFGKRQILQDVSMDIDPGRIITITGVSGAGKSTLLGIISGLLKPDSGTVCFEGKDIFKWWDFKRSSFRNRHIGFVFQFFSLFPDMTAYQNILYPALLNPFRSKKNVHDVDELIELLKLKDIIKQYPATLSGGERQRVAIARAVINSPRMILADEPTGNLDDENTTEIMELFQRLKNERKITTVIATHESKLVDISDINYHIVDGELHKTESKKETKKTGRPKVKTKQKTDQKPAVKAKTKTKTKVKSKVKTNVKNKRKKTESKG